MVVGEFTQDADVLVIGGGPAGYSCAFHAATLGRQVTLVDARESLGGRCLQENCIPTKTMLHDLTDGPHQADDMRTHITDVVGTLERGLDARAKAGGIEILTGTARFLNNREVQVAGTHVSRIRFKRAVICIGGQPESLAVEQEGPPLITAAGIAEAPHAIQGRVLIVGHGPEAIESAAMAATLGESACLLTRGSPLLPDVPEALTRRFVRQLDCDIDTNQLDSIGITDAQWTATCGEQIHHGDVLINAAPMKANNDALDLAAAGVKMDDAGNIVTDARCTTSEPRILAAGMCTGRPHYAGGAMAQGRVAAEVMCGQPAAYEPAAIPTLVFGRTQLAWSGEVTPSNAAERIMPWGASGLAVAMGDDRGCTMLRWDVESGTIIGAGAIGQCATELADAFTMAIELGATLRDLADMVCAHPTRSELLIEAARQALQANTSP